MRAASQASVVVSASLSRRLQHGHGSVKRPHASQVIKERPSTSIISLHGIAIATSGLRSVTVRWWGRRGWGTSWCMLSVMAKTHRVTHTQPSLCWELRISRSCCLWTRLTPRILRGRVWHHCVLSGCLDWFITNSHPPNVWAYAGCPRTPVAPQRQRTVVLMGWFLATAAHCNCFILSYYSSNHAPKVVANKFY